MTGHGSALGGADGAAAAATDLVGLEAQLRGLVVHAGIELGVVDLLDGDPRPADEVVDALELDPANGTRLLRTLHLLGVLAADEEGRLGLTAVGEHFTADHPASKRDLLRYAYDPGRVRVHRHLPAIVAEGGPAGYPREHGCGVYEYLERHPDFAAAFNGFQTANWGPRPDAIVDALAGYGLERLASLCDVGGGHGIVLAHLLEAHPDLVGVVLDLPHTVGEVDQHWAPKLGVDDRCTYVAGDMFEAVPAADAHLLSTVLHNWTDEECVDLLENVHRASPPAGQLFVYERAVPDGEPTLEWALLDCWMLLEVGGRERTLGEFERLFEAAGWRLAETLPMPGSHAVLVGEKR